MPRGIRKRKPREGSNPVGRPNKRTPEIVNILITCISKGLHVKTACGLAKIAESVFYEWLKKDVSFQSQINYARGAAVLRLHEKVEQQDPKFILKNLEPHLYRDKIEYEAPIVPIQINFGIPRPEHEINGSSTNNTASLQAESNPVPVSRIKQEVEGL